MTRLPAPPQPRTIGMVWRKTNPLANQLEQITACVREVAIAGTAPPHGFPVSVVPPPAPADP